MFRVQTINHTLGGRYIVLKRDNTHEQSQTPKPKHVTEWVIIDSDTLQSAVFTDPLLMQKHLRAEEQSILQAEAEAREKTYETAAAKAEFTDNFAEDPD